MKIKSVAIRKNLCKSRFEAYSYRVKLIQINKNALSVWNIRSLDFHLKDWQIDDIIDAGYKAAKMSLSKNEIVNV